MEKATYQLVGIINPLETSPEIVYPVFLKDNQFFLQVCALSTIIDSFREINYDDHLNMIRPLNDMKVSGDVLKKRSVGDEAVIALQTDPDSVFLGNMDTFKKYIKKHPIPRGMAYDQIEILKQDHQGNKQYLEEKEEKEK